MTHNEELLENLKEPTFEAYNVFLCWVSYLYKDDVSSRVQCSLF